MWLNKKICVLSANGGHLTEMKIVVNGLGLSNPYWITYKGKDSSDLEGLLFTDFHSRFLKFSIIFLYVLTIFSFQKPKKILATGGMIALPVALIAYFYKVKLVFFECGTRIEDLSKTAKIIFYLHGPVFVQNRQLHEKYPDKTIYAGALF